MKTRLLLPNSPAVTFFKGSERAWKIFQKTNAIPTLAVVEQVSDTSHFVDLSAPPAKIEPVWAVDQLEHVGLRDGFRAITHQILGGDDTKGPIHVRKNKPSSSEEDDT